MNPTLKRKLIILSGGKTMGHVSPLIAIYEYYCKEYDFVYIGLANSMEEEVCKRQNIPFISLDLLPFNRNNIFKNFVTFYKIFKAKKYLRDKFKKSDIKAVFTSGGYVSIPVVLALKNNAYKRILLEANSVMGLANKYLVNKVNYVVTQFDINKNYYNYGYPSLIKKPFFECHFFYQNKPLILILGGSNGALELVKYAYKLHLEFSQYNFIVLTGKYHFKLYEFKHNALVYEKINDVSSIFANCDLIISRAGGATIAELFQTNSRAILVPSRNVTNDHQYKNALALSQKKLMSMAENYQELVNKIPVVLSEKSPQFIKPKTLELISSLIN